MPARPPARSTGGRASGSRRRRARTAVFGVLAGLALALATTPPATAAAAVVLSDEASGGSVAARAQATALRTGWADAVTARGGTVPAPSILPGPLNTAVSGVIATAADGTTVSLQRQRYSAAADPVFVADSPNAGTAVCTGSGLTLQGSAPRPSLIVGNTGCTNGNGFTYTSFGGTGENTTRDALSFGFSRPVLAFGAWFADLETRTDGGGIPALVRLYDASGTLLSEQQVTPSGSQAGCGGGASACGNNTTRWIGFVADAATPVARMVVIVGDDEIAGGALNVGVGFIGPSLVTARTGITLTVAAEPGPFALGDVIPYALEVGNTGTLAITGAAVTEAGGVPVTCGSTTIAPGATATCTASHTVTQADVDAGSFAFDATASGTSWGNTITSSAASTTIALAQDPSATIALSADRATYSIAGDLIGYTIIATNTGTVTLSDPVVTTDLPGTVITCPAPAPLAPGATLACTAEYTVSTTGDPIENVARFAALAGAVEVDAASDAVSVAFDPPPIPTATITLTADRSTYAAAGDVIGYTIIATNTGTVTLTDPVVTTDLPGLVSCPAAAPLDPGDDLECTVEYVVTTTGPAIENAAHLTADAGAVDLAADSAFVVIAFDPTVDPVDPTDPIDPTDPEPELAGQGDAADDGLAGTGGAISMIAAAAGATLLGAGAVLLVRGRRRLRS